MRTRRTTVTSIEVLERRVLLAEASLIKDINPLTLNSFPAGAVIGVFAVSQTKERKARNPQTNEEVIVPAGKRARFRPGKALKEALN